MSFGGLLQIEWLGKVSLRKWYLSCDLKGRKDSRQWKYQSQGIGENLAYSRIWQKAREHLSLSFPTNLLWRLLFKRSKYSNQSWGLGKLYSLALEDCVLQVNEQFMSCVYSSFYKHMHTYLLFVLFGIHTHRLTVTEPNMNLATIKIDI